LPQPRGSNQNELITLEARGEVLGLGVAREDPSPGPGPPPPLIPPASGPAHPERASPAGRHLQQTPPQSNPPPPPRNRIGGDLAPVPREPGAAERDFELVSHGKWRDARRRSGEACVPGGGGGGGGGRGAGSAPPKRPSRPPPSVRGSVGGTGLAGDGLRQRCWKCERVWPCGLGVWTSRGCNGGGGDTCAR